MKGMSGTGPQRDYYEVLGVSRDAGAGDIRRAFRRKAILYHPDNNREDPETAERMFHELLEAFEALSDEFSRRLYDYAAGDRRVRFSPRDLARLGIGPAAHGWSGAAAAEWASTEPGRVRLRNPAVVAVAAAAVGLAGIPLAILQQTAGLVCGVAGLALATGALCSVGTTSLPLRAARVAGLARIFAVIALSVSGVGLAMRAGSYIVEYVINDPLWQREALLRSGAAYVVWSILAAAAFFWIGASRARLSREAQRWREYRFLLAALGVGLAYGVVSGQLAAGLSPEYFYYTELGAKSLPLGASGQAPAAGWLALKAGAEYIWKLGLSAGLAVLLANSPHRSVPQLSYRGMFRRIAGPLACVVACAAAFALAGAVGALGQLLRGEIILDRHRPLRVMSVRGWHVGELFGAFVAVAMILATIFAARRKRARQIHLDRIMRIQPLLPPPGGDAIE